MSSGLCALDVVRGCAVGCCCYQTVPRPCPDHVWLWLCCGRVLVEEACYPPSPSTHARCRLRIGPSQHELPLHVMCLFCWYLLRRPPLCCQSRSSSPSTLVSPRTRLLMDVKPVRPTALVCPWTFDWATTRLLHRGHTAAGGAAARAGDSNSTESPFAGFAVAAEHYHGTMAVTHTPAGRTVSSITGTAAALATSRHSSALSTTPRPSGTSAVAPFAVAPVGSPPSAAGGGSDVVAQWGVVAGAAAVAVAVLAAFVGYRLGYRQGRGSK